MRENDKEEKVKHEMDEIETINIELEHSVAKLLSENECLHKEIEHLKKTYKDQFDSIKKTRALSKEHDDSLIGMFKIDLEPLAPRLSNNREAHIDYLKHIQEQADILQGIVEQAKAKQQLDNALEFAYKHAKRIQELLIYVVHIFLWYLDSGCSKHMTGNHSQLMNFVSKFMGTVRFGNDQVAKILGYGDYQLGNDLCGPMRVESINGKKYILVIVNHYSRFTWVRFLRSKDEAPDAIIKCIKNIQVRLNATVRNVRTDNGTEFVNQTLCDFYENVGISHQTSVARTPQQNDVVERRNRNLVEAAGTMLIFSKAPLFLWAEAINTTCYTQNRSLISLCYNKTPYELMHDKKPNLSFLYVFGSLYYLTNDSEDLGKLNAKADTGIFVGYTPAKKAFRIYNRRTQKRLVPNPIPQQPCNPPNKDDWDHLFQPMVDGVLQSPTNVVSPVKEGGFQPERLAQGFTAALAVLITGASQSRQHGMSEPQSKVFPVFSTTNELFQALHDSSIQHLLIVGFDHDAGPLMIQSGLLPPPYGFVIP
ncbi:retrovirus-related pol polyprotein from transposon TNT 1-94 [Tanacetum coccineum]|uniref:Retrovirus-related pol polyprotein from transposon TNT 1-94 n=1 Tax=Tanacetum coccineum TaxID=301880 RepID=A0ABQ5BTL8_9ASTR